MLQMVADPGGRWAGSHGVSKGSGFGGSSLGGRCRCWQGGGSPLPPLPGGWVWNGVLGGGQWFWHLPCKHWAAQGSLVLLLGLPSLTPSLPSPQTSGPNWAV